MLIKNNLFLFRNGGSTETFFKWNIKNIKLALEPEKTFPLLNDVTSQNSYETFIRNFPFRPSYFVIFYRTLIFLAFSSLKQCIMHKKYDWSLIQLACIIMQKVVSCIVISSNNEFFEASSWRQYFTIQ